MNRKIKLNNTLTHTHTSYFLRSFDLSSVYKTGVIQTWLPITYSKKNKPSGSIHVILTFFGSETRFGPLLSRKETRYPCLGSGTTYGDSERINVVEKLDGTLLASPVSKQGKQGKSAGLVESVGGEAVGARPGQSFGSAPPVSQDYTVNVKAAGSGKGVSKEESIVSSKMSKLDNLVSSRSAEIAAHKDLDFGSHSALVINPRALHLHETETLTLAKDLASKSLKDKMSRYGVGVGVSDEKLGKKMEMLERSRGEMGEGGGEAAREMGRKVDASVRGEVEGRVQEGEVSPRTKGRMKEMVYDGIERERERSVGNVEDKLTSEEKKQLVEKMIGGDNSDVEQGQRQRPGQRPGPGQWQGKGPRIRKSESVHMDQARDGIKYAITELPKQSEYDHEDYDKGVEDKIGGKVKGEVKEGVRPLASSIERSVLDLPEFSQEDMDFDDEEEEQEEEVAEEEVKVEEDNEQDNNEKEKEDLKLDIPASPNKATEEMIDESFMSLSNDSELAGFSPDKPRRR